MLYIRGYALLLKGNSSRRRGFITNFVRGRTVYIKYYVCPVYGMLRPFNQSEYIRIYTNRELSRNCGVKVLVVSKDGREILGIEKMNVLLENLDIREHECKEEIAHFDVWCEGYVRIGRGTIDCYGVRINEHQFLWVDKRLCISLDQPYSSIENTVSEVCDQTYNDGH